jgi:hypothetical protein
MLAGCSSSLVTAPAVRRPSPATAAMLDSLVVNGPSGWTAQPSPNTRAGACTGGVTSPNWIVSRARSWRESSTQPVASLTSIPSIQVCLSLFSSSADAEGVQGQIAAQVGSASSPGSATPSSVPQSLTVPGVPGAVASFVDFSTVGQENIEFVSGDVLASIVVLCAPEGGQSCAIGISSAQEQYRRLADQRR